MSKGKKFDPPQGTIRVNRKFRIHDREIGEIKRRTANVEKGVDFILNKVSANGHPGLENSLRDIHTEIKSLGTSLSVVLEATKTSRAWTDVRKSVRSLMRESTIGAIVTNKVGRWGTVLLLILTMNSLLHAIGVGLDVQSLLRFVRIIP